MSTIVLLGAGASYGSGPCTPHPPPLGPRLFQALRVRGGVAATIDDGMAALFEENFELGMFAFRKVRDRDTTALLREMGEYFVQFATLPGNQYHEFVRLVRDAREPVVLATTNYDLLIEQAVTEAGLRVAYHAPPVPDGNIPLLKIHGSCHFLPDVGGARLTGVTFSGNAVNVETRMRIARSRDEVLQFCRSEDSLAPAIAVYAPGKAVLFSSQGVKEQQQHWTQVVSTATRVISIGLRLVPEDDHIWGVIRASNAELCYVGGEPEDVRAWFAGAGETRVRVLGSTFAESLPRLRDELGKIHRAGV